jgi:hypothetical protein
MYVLSEWNKVILPWVCGHSGIQSNEDADALARERAVHSSALYQQSQSQHVLGRLKIKEWLGQKHSEHWATTLGTRLLKLFTEELLNKLSLNQLILDRKRVGLLTDHCALR